jgi:DNA-binding NarL/FixJ family response regulator
MKNLRILIVDDHEVLRRGLHALLKTQLGWEVVGEAVDGWEAVGKASQLQPDVVILDIGMPRMNGLDATPLILAAAPQSEVLIYTMCCSEQIMQTALAAGARGYVLKSDEGRNLLAAVEALSKHSTFFTSSVTQDPATMNPAPMGAQERFD